MSEEYKPLLQLIPPSSNEFTDEEVKQLGYIFDHVVVRKFFNTRMYTSLVQYANLPLDTLAGDDAKLKAAYIKGSLNLIHDVLRVADQFAQESQDHANLKNN